MTWQLTPELEETIITLLEQGVGLRAICRKEDMPSRSTVLRWQRENAVFDAKCAHAREAAGDLSAEEQGEVINGCLSGKIAPDVARVVLSGLQWRASKLASKKYGDKITHAGDASAPIVTVNKIERAIIDPKLNDDA